MPNGIEELRTKLTEPLRTQFEKDLLRAQTLVRTRFKAADIHERLKLDLPALEEKARVEVESRYKQRLEVEKLRQDVLAGAFPEPFQDWGSGLTEWSDETVIQTQRLTDLEWQMNENQKQLEALRASSTKDPFQVTITRLAGIFESLVGIDRETKEEKLLKARNLLLDQMSDASSLLNKANIYTGLYNALPAYVGNGTVTSLEELLDYRAEPGDMTLREGGYTENDPVISELFTKVLRALVPEGTEYTGELDYDAIAAAIVRPVKVVPKPMHRIQIEELVAMLTASMAMRPEDLPGSPTAEEALNSFKKAGLTEEEVAELDDIEAYIRTSASHFSDIMKQNSLVKLGLEEARMPELGIMDELKMAMVQPGMMALQLVGKLYTNWIAPWAGLQYRTWGHYLDILPGIKKREDTGFDLLYNEARKTEDWWMAGSIAMEEGGMGWANRLVFEWLADPLSWFGTTIPTKITKPLGMFGKAVGATERGWLKMWDVLIFDQMKALGRRIPKTPMQASRQSATLDFHSVAGYLVKASGGINYKKIPIEKAQDLLLMARRYALKHPDDWSTDIGRAGQATLRRSQPAEEELAEWLTRLGAIRPVTREFAIEVYNVLGDLSAFGSGRLFNQNAAPRMLLRTIGVAESGKNVKIAQEILKDLRIGAMKASDDLFRGVRNTPELLSKVYMNTLKADWATRTGLAAHNWEMAGAMVSRLSKVSWPVMNAWRNTIDRWAITPFARTYLAFSAYGPFNILEGYAKPAHAGINPFWKRGYDPSLHMQRTWAGISKPMELELAIPRIEMAGETPVIADIVSMSPNLRRWRSAISGGPIGRFFVDLPGKLGNQQRTNYWHKMAMRMLGEESGPMMQTLTTKIDDFTKSFPKEWFDHLGLSRKELNQELLERAVAGPTVLRNTIDDMVSERIAATRVSLRDAMGDRIAGGRVEAAASKYTQIPAAMQETVVTKASNGSLWKNFGRTIDDTVDDMRFLKIDEVVHTPEFYSGKIKTFIDDLVASPPRNVDEFKEFLLHIRNIQRAFTESLDDVNRAVSEMERAMVNKLRPHEWNIWRSAYRDEATVGQINYAKSAPADFERALTTARKSLEALDLTSIQKGHVNSMIDTWTDEMRYITKGVADINETRRALLAKKPTKREEVTVFWDEYFKTIGKSWDDLRTGHVPFRTRTETMTYTVDEALGMAGPPPPIIDASARKLTKVDLANLFHANPANASLAALRLDTMALRSRAEFIHDVKIVAERMANSAGKNADTMGWTDDAISEVYDYIVREMRMSPTAASVAEPALMEMESLRHELWGIYNSKALPEGMAEKFQARLLSFADDMGDIPGYSAGGKLTDDFSAIKQRSADRASKEYYKDFADYTNENATTAFMRAFFPFWTYELHRPFWVVRTSLRQPGVFKAWGSYMDYTEDGYVHIPGTSVSFNPLRGTIWSGGMIRLIRADYPEFYDRYKGFAETMDYYSRFGFYPAAYLNFLKVVGGTSAGGRPMYGELIPAWLKTPLNAFVAAFPDSEPAKILRDVVLPDPYREYTIMLVANKICQNEKKDFNGRDLWGKIKEGIALSEEEQRIWTKAERELSFYGAIMDQAGILKIQTGNQLKAWEQAGLLIEEITGYTPEQQLYIRRVGQRVGDYVQLSPMAQDVLQEMDAIKYHSGVTLALMPSSWQEEDRVRSEFFHEIEALSDDIRGEGRLDVQGILTVGQAGIDQQARNGEISMGQWDNARGELRQMFTNGFNALASTDRYKNVPITLEDVVDAEGNVIRDGLATSMEKRGKLPPVMEPGREILNFYYALQVVREYNLETGKLEWDWDGYFLKVDTIITTLKEVGREDLINHITREYTDLEKLRWQVAKEWFLPYNRKTEVVIAQFEPDEQSVIREYFAAPPERQLILRELTTAEGKKIVAQYEQMSRQAGVNLRIMNPELDAWLLFFDKIDKPQTDAAMLIYRQLKMQWGLPL